MAFLAMDFPSLSQADTLPRGVSVESLHTLHEQPSTPKQTSELECPYSSKVQRVRSPSVSSEVSTQVDDPALWSAGSFAGEPQSFSPRGASLGAARYLLSAASSAFGEAEIPDSDASHSCKHVATFTDEQIKYLVEQKQTQAYLVRRNLMQCQPVPACVINGVNLNLRAKSLAPLGHVRFPGGKIGGVKRSRFCEDEFEVRCVQPRGNHRLQLPHGHLPRVSSQRACNDDDLTQFAIRAAEEDTLAALVTAELDASQYASAMAAVSSRELAAVPAAVAIARQARFAQQIDEIDADTEDTIIASASSLFLSEQEALVLDASGCDGGFSLGALFQGTEAPTSPFSIDAAL